MTTTRRTLRAVLALLVIVVVRCAGYVWQSVALCPLRAGPDGRKAVVGSEH
jgi:hypothetical protein